MRLALQTKARQHIAILFFSFLAIGFLIACTRHFLAERSGNSHSIIGFEQSTKLEPANAEYWRLLGQLKLFVGADAKDTIGALLEAVRLDPYDSSNWLALASARGVFADQAGSAAALKRALEVNPTDPTVAWQAANEALVTGDTSTAFRQFRTVITFDPKQADEALRMSWLVSGDVQQMLREVVPPTLSARLKFLRLLQSEVNPSAALLVWAEITASHNPVQQEDGLIFVDFLIDQQKYSAASNTWHQLLELDPALRPYSSENLVTNGGFEESVLNHGLDWRVNATPGVQISSDTSRFYSGNRSLSIEVNARELQSFGLYQYVAVQPSSRYHLSGFFRAQGLQTSSEPVWMIYDPREGRLIAATTGALENGAWHEQSVDFSTGPGDHMILLRLDRKRPQTAIFGEFGIDDVSIRSVP